MIPSIGGLPPEATLAIGGLALILLGYLAGYFMGFGRKEHQDLKKLDDIEGGEGFEMTAYGPGEDAGFIRTYLRDKKKRAALSKGMVRWHLVGSNFSQAMYVKPERENGGNIPEIEHGDETYVFPEDAAVPSEEEGVPVVVHRVGESEPINLRDSWEDAIDAGTLTQYLTLRVTSQAPSKGLLDGMGDWDSMKIFRYGLLGIVGLALLMETLGGGLW